MSLIRKFIRHSSTLNNIKYNTGYMVNNSSMTNLILTIAYCDYKDFGLIGTLSAILFVALITS